MDDKASVGKISVSSDSVSTLNSEDFVLISRQGDETPSTNNGSDDEKTGLKVRACNLSSVQLSEEFGIVENRQREATPHFLSEQVIYWN